MADEIPAPLFEPLPRCKGKVIYPSKKDAQSQRNFALKRHYKRPDILRIYDCPDCDGWHLSSKK